MHPGRHATSQHANLHAALLQATVLQGMPKDNLHAGAQGADQRRL